MPPYPQFHEVQKKRIFDIQKPSSPLIHQIPQMIPEPFIPCEFCNIPIPFSKLENHTKGHLNYPREKPVPHSPFQFQRGYSAQQQHRNEHHDFPQPFQPTLHDRGPFRRVHQPIFNEEGLREIRIMEIPRNRRFRRGEHHEKRRAPRKFSKEDIENLFPVIKYDAAKEIEVEEENKKCSICLGEFENGEEIRFLTCLHRFHKDCIDAWLSKKNFCPYCKKDLVKLIKMGEQIVKNSKEEIRG